MENIEMKAEIQNLRLTLKNPDFSKSSFQESSIQKLQNSLFDTSHKSDLKDKMRALQKEFEEYAQEEDKSEEIIN